uniref:Retrovirus-related Pol polyprotein from transposon TNT 1-94 n=1 Tax=Tanacetum cinerariifolium TaxID=118510 RepID=A0A699HMS8_TANCI|nr:retrovirus-related Pol polyprotein from transposon TNT 1-94 [Tanacetum cinerariifolium]
MEQPEGFVNPKYPNRVCKLKHSIYGLKQASRHWNKRFDDEIKKFGFTQNRDEPCVYLKASGSNMTFLILYVDDILIMGNNIPMLQSVKTYLGRCFGMKDLGEAAYILGIKIYRDRSRRLIGLCQSAYIEKNLKRYCMKNSERGTVGSIMYAVRCTRPDVAFAQNVTSRFQQNSGDLHWTTVKNILKYLRNTKDMFLTGYVLVLNGGAVDWKSARQIIFATSSTKAEYIAAFDDSKEAVWVRKFISGLGLVPSIEEPISMYYDNTRAIAIANESRITKGARHFRAKVHYLREVIEYGDIKLEKVHTDDNLADPFTKALAFPKHSEHIRNIEMLPACSLMLLMLLHLFLLELALRVQLNNRDSCLQLSYPRLFALENNKVCMVAAKMSAPFVSSLRRDVRGGEESAQLSRISDFSIQWMLDDILLSKSDVPSRWVKQIPIKVNVLAWKIYMDRLPTRVNLHRRGVQVSPISCPICCEALENLDHLLFCCDLAKDIARSICNWWGLVWNPVDSYRSWFNLVQL